MLIFVSNKSTKFCQITLHIKRVIHKRKVVPFFCITALDWPSACWWSAGTWARAWRRASSVRHARIWPRSRKTTRRWRSSPTPTRPRTTAIGKVTVGSTTHTTLEHSEWNQLLIRCEGNRRSGHAPQTSVVHHGLRKGDEHPAYTP